MSKRTNGLRPAAIGLIALALLIVIYLVFWGGDSDDGSGEQGSAEQSGTVTTTAPTTVAPTVTTEASPSEPPVSNPPEPSSPPTPYSPQATQAAPGGDFAHIAIAGYNAETKTLEVTASAPTLATDKAVCTLTAVNGAVTLTVQQDAEFDGRGASCGLMSLSVDGQPAGTWQVSVVLESPMGDASAAPVEIVVA